MGNKKETLEHLCNVSIGRTPPRAESQWFNSGFEDDWKWLSIKDMGMVTKHVGSTSETITAVGQKIFNIPVVKKGTVLVSFKLTVGRVAVADCDFLTNEAIAQLPIKNSTELDRDYLFYYLKSYPWSTLGNTSSIATAVNSKMIKQIVVEYPPLTLQKKKGSILSAIDDKIELNERINANLEEEAMSIFKEKIALFNNVPQDWNKEPLDSVADYLNGLAMQKFEPIGNEESLPVLKIAELKQGFCDENSNRCHKRIKPEYIVHNGDVIFSWSASLVVDFWCSGTVGLNQHLFKVTSKKYDKWFYYCWTKYYLNDFIHEASAKATTMGHITRDRLTKAICLIPDKKTYEEIGSLLTPVLDSVIKNRLENKRLAELRDTLLPKLMSGDIDVSEVEDL